MKKKTVVLLFITALILNSCNKKIYNNFQENIDNRCLISFSVVMPNNYQITMNGISDNYNTILLDQLDYTNLDAFLTSFYKNFCYTIDTYLINDDFLFVCDDVTLDHKGSSIAYKKPSSKKTYSFEQQKGEVYFFIYPISKGNDIIKFNNLNCITQGSNEVDLDSQNIDGISFAIINPKSDIYP